VKKYLTRKHRLIKNVLAFPSKQSVNVPHQKGKVGFFMGIKNVLAYLRGGVWHEQ
jgi:hypothetical protein